MEHDVVHMERCQGNLIIDLINGKTGHDVSCENVSGAKPPPKFYHEVTLIVFKMDQK